MMIQAMEVAKKKANMMESLRDLENQERELRIRLESKRMEFEGEHILKGDAVEYLTCIDFLCHPLVYCRLSTLDSVFQNRALYCTPFPSVLSAYDMNTELA